MDFLKKFELKILKQQNQGGSLEGGISGVITADLIQINILLLFMRNAGGSKKIVTVISDHTNRQGFSIFLRVGIQNFVVFLSMLLTVLNFPVFLWLANRCRKLPPNEAADNSGIGRRVEDFKSDLSKFICSKLLYCSQILFVVQFILFFIYYYCYR